ncbi:MAG: hypothetical protein J7539_10650 [Niabella sp.]|nr:hypothetical protein [Niabella sp.]
MKTILVPVDATATAENAAKFAAEWGQQYGYDHIVLLNTHYESVFDYVTMAEGYAFVDGENVTSRHKNTELLLAHLRGIILAIAPLLKVTGTISRIPLLRSTIDFIKNDPSVELIILGSDDEGASNDSLVAANIVGIARASSVKTLIVPRGLPYKAIKNVLVPFDIYRTTNLERLSKFRSVLKAEDARLLLLNIDTKESTTLAADKKKEWEQNLGQYFTDIPYSIYYSSDRDIIKGILSFAQTNNVDLITALPGKHSFLYYLVNRSISEGIYKNRYQAVLILK